MSKNAQANWDDMRFVVAVADHGSVAAAAKVLGVNHATVLRRISAFEELQGIRFFEKTRRGYRVLVDRRGVIEAMRDAALAFGQVEQMIDQERPNLMGGIRVTSTDTFCQFVLPPILSQLGRDLGVRIEVISDNAHLDFERSQAHITVRPAISLPPEMEGQRAVSFRFAAFGAPQGDTVWLGLSGPLARSVAGAWVRNQGDVSPVSADSFLTLAGLAAEGAGRALLPCVVGDRWPGLKRLFVPEDIPPVALWVASHRDFAKSGRLQRARRALVAELARREPVLMGKAPAIG